MCLWVHYMLSLHSNFFLSLSHTHTHLHWLKELWDDNLSFTDQWKFMLHGCKFGRAPGSTPGGIYFTRTQHPVLAGRPRASGELMGVGGVELLWQRKPPRSQIMANSPSKHISVIDIG